MTYDAQLSLRLILAYKGTRYCGWQETREGPSVQGVLRSICRQILASPVEIEAASRTDAGVHAEGQVVVIRSEHPRYSPKRFLQSLRRLLPSDIAIVDGVPCAHEFHPTLSALGKCYRYRFSTVRKPLLEDLCWELPLQAWGSLPLNIEAMRVAAASLLGIHDFTALATQQTEHPVKNACCHLSKLALVKVDEGLWDLFIEGDRFLYKMCRSLAGTLIDCGRGRIDPLSIPEILKSRRRELAGLCAPPHGLTLIKVLYPVDLV
jgi:tRNA pseudouridine38-40 synthase